jgi:alcohol dehydrogenase class IV
VLIVTGKNSTIKTGLLDKTVSFLKKAGIKSVVFDQVKQNPLTTTAYAGASIAKEENCDFVV